MATKSHTPADSWRKHRLRQRAKGQGRHPLPAGRYSTLKKKLNGTVESSPTLTLDPRQLDLLTEVATLDLFETSRRSLIPKTTKPRLPRLSGRSRRAMSRH